MGVLRSSGVWCVVYINDLLLHQHKDKFREFSATALKLLGFLMNFPNLELTQLIQTLIFFGFTMNSCKGLDLFDWKLLINSCLILFSMSFSLVYVVMLFVYLVWLVLFVVLL